MSTEGTTPMAQLSPESQIVALQAQVAELLRENNELRRQVDRSLAEQADAADVQRRYDALRNSTLGKVTTRYWEFRRNLRKSTKN